MRKTKKRFLSALLACAMIVSLFPFAAFANGTAVTTQTFYVDATAGSNGDGTENSPYKDLQSAVTAASTNPTTIVLQSDISLNTAVNLVNDQNITITGNGHSISYSFANNAGVKVAFTGSAGGQVEGIPSGVTLTVNNVEFINTAPSADAAGDGQGYAALIGGNSVGTAVALNQCSFENLYCGVYVNQFTSTQDADNAPKLSITDSTYTNTTYGYSIDETTSTVVVGAVDVQFGSDNISTTANFLDKEYWKGAVYVTDSNGVTHPYYTYNDADDSLAEALAAAVDGDTITLNPGEYSGFKVTNKSLNFVGRTIGGETAVVNDATVMFADKVSFEGITFNGASNAIHGDTNPSALYLQGVGSASVKNCVFDLANGYQDENTFAIVTSTTANTVVEDCTIDGYKTAGYHNPDPTENNSLNQSVTYKNNTIQNVPNGVAFVGTKTVVVEGNVFENSNGIRLEPSWENSAEPCATATISENKFNVPEDENSFAVKTINSEGNAGFTGSLNLNYNYWGNRTPDFDKLIQTGDNENITVVTDEYYKAPEMNESDLNTYYTGKYSYAINVADADNGSVSVDKYATEGEKVTLTVSPDKAYKLDELTVTANGKDVELTNNGDGTYTFTMPSSKVQISAAFVEDEDYVAPDTSITVSMTIGSNDFVINNNIVTVPDAAPYIANSRTYVPFRALGEALGATVEWDNDARTVTYTLGDTEIVMTIGDTTYTINGVEKSMDVAPEITGDRTYVPVRFVAEGLGFKVTPLYAEDGTTASVVFEK